MCIIIALPSLSKIKKEITSEILSFSWESNKDGAGYSYIDKVGTPEAKIIIKKGFFKYANFFKKFSEDRKLYENSNFIIHFRYSTYGNTKAGNCHPFYIDGTDAVMAHNGSLYKMDAKKFNGPSDSKLFANFLKELPKKWYLNSGYDLLIAEYLTSTNKIVVMTKHNDVLIWNKSYGFVEDDIWFSSDYYKYKRTTISNITKADNKNDDKLSINKRCCVCRTGSSEFFITIDRSFKGFCSACYKILDTLTEHNTCICCDSELMHGSKYLCEKCKDKDDINNIYNNYGEI